MDDGWFRIDDTENPPPKDGTPVDLWTKRGTYYSDRWQRYPDMWFAHGLNVWRNDKGDIQIDPNYPTHWRPLPTPPVTP